MDNLRTILNKQFNLLSTVCVLDPQFKPFPASMIASSILYVARKRLCLDPWPTHLQHITRTDIQECSEIIQLIEMITNDYSAQLTSSMKTLTMTVSPVKVPSNYNNNNGVTMSSYQTPPLQQRLQQQQQFKQHQHYHQHHHHQHHQQQQQQQNQDLTISISEIEEDENTNPHSDQIKPALLQSDISPFSVAIFPSPLG